MQDAIKLGNVRKLEKGSKEVQVRNKGEKQVQPNYEWLFFL